MLCVQVYRHTGTGAAGAIPSPPLPFAKGRHFENCDKMMQVINAAPPWPLCNLDVRVAPVLLQQREAHVKLYMSYLIVDIQATWLCKSSVVAMKFLIISNCHVIYTVVRRWLWTLTRKKEHQKVMSDLPSMKSIVYFGNIRNHTLVLKSNRFD